VDPEPAAAADPRQAHIEIFAGEGRPVTEQTEIVLERFELLWAPAA
jgi:hypothetical protein